MAADFSTYRFTKVLGEGSFGQVKLAEHTVTGKKVAVKVLKKQKIQNDEDAMRVQREIRVLSLLRHPNISMLYEVSNTDQKIYLVMEYEAGGELFDYIVAHQKVHEKQARRFFRQILSAVDYCHENFIIHRDLKPENLLLDADSQIKIIDFGFTNTFRDQELLKTFCGSPAYAAPEMVIGKAYLGPQVDIWSMGVILFAIVCGYLPFDDPSVNSLYKKIVRGKYTVPDFMSASCKDLISQMLVPKPTSRATLEQLKNHPWVMDGYDSPPANNLPVRHSIPPGGDPEVMKQLVEMGFNQEKVATAINSGENGLTTCAYHLCQEKMLAEEAEARRLQQSLMEKGKEKRARNISHKGGMQPIGEGSALKVTEPSKPKDSPKPVRKPRRKSYHPGAEHAKDIEELNFTSGRSTSKTTEKMVIPAHKSKGKGEKDFSETTVTALPPTGAAPSRGGASMNADGTKKHARDRKKRFSLGAAMASVVGSFGSKEKEKSKLRVVRGPFSVATTSNKAPDEIKQEVERVLQANDIVSKCDGYVYVCTDSSGTKFELEICSLERLTLHGIRLKRVSGDTWAYKRLCLLLLSQMKL